MAKSHDPASRSPGAASEARSWEARPRSLRSGSEDSHAGRAEADPLSDVLASVRLSAALFFEVRGASPWVAEVPESRFVAPILVRRAQQLISYHIVTRGTCWAHLVDGSAVRLDAGDAVLFPGGDSYVMSSQPGLRSTQTLEQRLEHFRELAARHLPVVELGDGARDDCQIVCGYLACDTRPFNPAIAALPALAHVSPPADPAEDRVRWLAEYALAESRGNGSGGRSVLLRLSELMFVEVIRRYLAALPAEQRGWLAGLRDPVVGRSLCLLHANAGEAWTLQRLAGEVGVSRSVLAERFASFVGQPPMRYLAHWRMQLAARMLAEEDAKVRVIATRVGYESEEAFSRAFKRMVGVSPSIWRRQISGNARGR